MYECMCVYVYMLYMCVCTYVQVYVRTFVFNVMYECNAMQCNVSLRTCVCLNDRTYVRTYVGR